MKEKTISLQEKLNAAIKKEIDQTMIKGISNVLYSISDMPELFAAAEEVAWDKVSLHKHLHMNGKFYSTVEPKLFCCMPTGSILDR